MPENTKLNVIFIGHTNAAGRVLWVYCMAGAAKGLIRRYVPKIVLTAEMLLRAGLYCG